MRRYPTFQQLDAAIVDLRDQARRRRLSEAERTELVRLYDLRSQRLYRLHGQIVATREKLQRLEGIYSGKTPAPAAIGGDQ